MDTLKKIVTERLEDIRIRKELIPVKMLEQSIYFETKPISLKKYLLREDKSGVIAEIKRRSPSQGYLNNYISIEKTSIGYMQAGASALSILTEAKHFGGNSDDLTTARKYNFCPILRKDFILDEYQILETKSIGADAMLLIVSILTQSQLKEFSKLAGKLGMEVLIEVHNAEELGMALHIENAIIGINNRNLKTFKVSLANSEKLVKAIPGDRVTVSESGIEKPKDVIRLSEMGFNGFLIGTRFMQNDRPEIACKQFIDQMSKLKNMIKTTL